MQNGGPGPPFCIASVETSSERLLDQVADLAHDAAAEQQHHDDEDDALHDGHPRAQLRQVVLHGHHQGYCQSSRRFTGNRFQCAQWLRQCEQ